MRSVVEGADSIGETKCDALPRVQEALGELAGHNVCVLSVAGLVSALR